MKSMARMSRAALVFIAGTSLAIACHKEGDGPAIEKTHDQNKRQRHKEPPRDPEATKEPKRHRESSSPCEKETKKVKYGPRMPIPAGAPCKANADCKEEKNGRCSAAGACTYDGCYTDADCRAASKGKGGVCVCDEEGRRGWYCLQGDCSVDADCGKGNYCSPTYGMSCGPFTGTVGWYCHTAKDTCSDDQDCTKDGKPGYCAFDTEIGHWACGYGFCVG